MSEINNNETPVMQTAASEAAAIETLETEIGTDAIPAKKGYRNKTARLLNGVFVFALIITIALLLFQAGFTVFANVQQGAPTTIAALYALMSISTPFALCIMSFLFKFFAEVVELMDRSRA